MARFKQKYIKEIQPALQELFKYKNVHMIPKMEKIVINCVTKDAVGNSKAVQSIINDLTVITGQRAVVAKAKKSIASFKVREGMPLGACVTLRGVRMYEFLDRFISISLPRVRDFRGVSPKAFDGRGNYTLGVKEQVIFPEINYDKIDKVRGVGICIATTAKTDNEGRELLKRFGMPFRD